MTGPTTKRLAPPANLPGLARRGHEIIQSVAVKGALIGGVAVQDIVARYLDRAARLAGRADVAREYDDSK